MKGSSKYFLDPADRTELEKTQKEQEKLNLERHVARLRIYLAQRYRFRA